MRKNKFTNLGTTCFQSLQPIQFGCFRCYTAMCLSGATFPGLRRRGRQSGHRHSAARIQSNGNAISLVDRPTQEGTAIGGSRRGEHSLPHHMTLTPRSRGPAGYGRIALWGTKGYSMIEPRGEGFGRRRARREGCTMIGLWGSESGEERLDESRDFYTIRERQPMIGDW